MRVQVEISPQITNDVIDLSLLSLSVVRFIAPPEPFAFRNLPRVSIFSVRPLSSSADWIHALVILPLVKINDSGKWMNVTGVQITYSLCAYPKYSASVMPLLFHRNNPLVLSWPSHTIIEYSHMTNLGPNAHSSVFRWIHKNTNDPKNSKIIDTKNIFGLVTEL